jgi:hypothetical protein
MPNLPNHRNPYTGEVLANAVEVCTACHKNFASTRAGDKHRVTRNGSRVCLDPSSVGLELITNSYGSMIYRKPVRSVRAGIREPIKKSARKDNTALLIVA